MRDPNRLYEFYDTLNKIHREHCPDWRFGQLISNVFGNQDIFYLEEDKFLEAVKTYFGEK